MLGACLGSKLSLLVVISCAGANAGAEDPLRDADKPFKGRGTKLESSYRCAEYCPLKPGEKNIAEFRCKNGRCISVRLLCNGFPNCPDGSDEDDCSKVVHRGFDCQKDFDHWGGAWSVDKKAWCCQHHKVGCLPKITRPHDCKDDRSHWREWHHEKKRWCCALEGFACLAPSSHANSTSSDATSAHVDEATSGTSTRAITSPSTKADRSEQSSSSRSYSRSRSRSGSSSLVGSTHPDANASTKKLTTVAIKTNSTTTRTATNATTTPTSTATRSAVSRTGATTGTPHLASLPFRSWEARAAMLFRGVGTEKAMKSSAATSTTSSIADSTTTTSTTSDTVSSTKTNTSSTMSTTATVTVTTTSTASSIADSTTTTSTTSGTVSSTKTNTSSTTSLTATVTVTTTSTVTTTTISETTTISTSHTTTSSFTSTNTTTKNAANIILDYHGNVPCAEHEVSWSPLDGVMPMKTFDHKSGGVTACQALCRETHGCEHFSYWWPGRNCHLTGASALRLPNQLYWVAGPPVCLSPKLGSLAFEAKSIAVSADGAREALALRSDVSKEHSHGDLKDLRPWRLAPEGLPALCAFLFVAILAVMLLPRSSHWRRWWASLKQDMPTRGVARYAPILA